jgi:hypothetical protein
VLLGHQARRCLHARDHRRHHRCHRCSTRPTNRHRHRGWTSDLFSFQARPELDESPVDTCLHPWSTVRSVGCTTVTLYSTCIQRWAPALFSRSRAQSEKRARKREEKRARRKKSVKKSESAKRERKKREFALFPPPHSGNLVSEPKAAWQGECKGLK